MGLHAVPSQQPPWLRWLTTCPSTNSWAIAHLPQLHHGDAVYTPLQTNGRGQYGRVWSSPSGVITVSFVLTGIPTATLPLLSLLSGLAVIYAIEDLAPELRDRLQLKWPNDVLIEGKKLAGILCEGTMQGETPTGSIVVGIGVNLSAELDGDCLPHAASLHHWVRNVPKDLELLASLRHYLLQAASLLCLSEPNPANSQPMLELIQALQRRNYLQGKSIAIDVSGEILVGVVEGLSDRGYLLLRLSNDEVRSLISGHILSIRCVD